MTPPHMTNPFDGASDPDRHAIWQMLMARDSEAFIKADWAMVEGDFDAEEGYAVCPRHGAHIDIRTGKPLTLPAVLPVETFPVRVEDGMVKVDVS